MDKENNKNQYKHHYAMVIISERCLGCDACYAACKYGWDVPEGEENWRTKVLEIEDSYPDNTPKVSFLPLLCNHCTNAPCIDVCPTGASQRLVGTDVVVVDSDMCIGCKACMEACPYEARYFNEKTKTVDKCTFCIPRVSNGLEPFCVRTCVGKSRNFGDINDPDSEVSKLLKEAAEVHVLKPEEGTQPNVYYITLSKEQKVNWEPEIKH